MKKLNTLIIAGILALITNITFAQKDSIYISKIVDDMSDKVYYFPSRKMVCATDDKKMGFSVSAFLEAGDGFISVSDMKIVMVNIGNCVEKNEIIILFEDDTKLMLTSWNEFNCKGDAWFKLSRKDKDILSAKKMKKIKVQNGRTYESFTKEVDEDDQSYFIQLFNSAQTNKIKLEKE